MYYVTVSVNMCLLRILSFGMDYHWAICMERKRRRAHEEQLSLSPSIGVDASHYDRGRAASSGMDREEEEEASFLKEDVYKKVNHGPREALNGQLLVFDTAPQPFGEGHAHSPSLAPVQSLLVSCLLPLRASLHCRTYHHVQLVRLAAPMPVPFLDVGRAPLVRCRDCVRSGADRGDVTLLLLPGGCGSPRLGDLPAAMGSLHHGSAGGAFFPTHSLSWRCTGFANITIKFIQFYCFWRIGRGWAAFDGIDVPENMPFWFFNNDSFQSFWRHWHASFNKWILRLHTLPF